MRVAHLSLKDFRNYVSAELPLKPGPNLLFGKNGQGKTNLVEAVGFFSTLRSHRVSSDAAMVRGDAPAAIARMKVAAGERDVILEAQINRVGANRAQLNGNPVRARELTRWFSSVLFAPEDLTIVRGEPSVRRRFMDDALAARLPIAGGALNDYEKIVKQRTALLKSARTQPRSAIESTLSVWDEQLVEHGVRIMLARRDLITDLETPMRDAYTSLVGADHSPTMRVFESVADVLEGVNSHRVSRETGLGASRASQSMEGPSVSRETLTEQFHEAIQLVRQREFDRGVTLVGPHRDDILLSLNSLPVKGYASHGESWSFALALKVGLANVLRAESSAGDPVILLDDVFAELDTGRRERLMQAVSDFEQVIVTSAVREDIPAGLDWHEVQVIAGELVEGT
ncbi:DNA replication/repair protein RecF [Leucobacter sp. cx-328]|uniref:DNA replication/repair protein RecF n=1 Tax=unclassified Leucobacter TaxID=2621730 RepID=UPI00165E0006|nr:MULTISPECIES: DNA replication/repair protein RecF [unclassified Leucobacter]MBC9943474.1 DNA replication/repair protein RecF [Leucobacter sp. cx-328]